MEDPKTVVKEEPRKSLIVLLIMAAYNFILGGIILIGVPRGTAPIAENVGWVMMIIGVLSVVLFVVARRHRLKQKK
ncbi:hypothetical protein QC823_06335 [Halomonas vilamensis]|uniref:LPXTG cell wall anchor domain-containing protein n=1 Tax=Vreelandella vilamensis TaxID=531309 RepID=A0ABU1H2U3_9GAMM|nr:hypothetical protein [Halomonas vilamensis]MDR5898601.1 hypothetical protein [Halomonas vilamensis]